MPIAPSNLQMISTDAPGLQTPASTAVPAALAKAGGDFAQVTTGLVIQQKEMEARAYVHDASLQDNIESENFANELKLKYPDGYIRDANGVIALNKDADSTPRTISQEYRDWANTKFQERQDRAPSLRAQQVYQEEAGKFFTSRIAQVQGQEFELRVKADSVRRAEADMKMQNVLTVTPDVGKLYEFANMQEKDVVSGVGVIRSQVQAQEEILSNQAALSHVTVEGAKNFLESEAALKNGEGGRRELIQGWIDRLEGKFQKAGDQASVTRQALGLKTIDQMLNPLQKAQHIEDLQRMLKQTEGRELSDLNRRQANMLASIKNGRIPQTQLSASMSDIVNGYKKLVAKNRITPYEAADQIFEMQVAAEATPTLTALHFILSSPEEKSKVVDRILQNAERSVGQYFTPEEAARNREFGGVAIANAKRDLEAQIAQTTREFEQDFAGTAIKYDPDTKAAASQVEAALAKGGTLASAAGALTKMASRLEKLGMIYFGGENKNFKYLSDGMAESVAGFITSDTKNVGQVTQGLWTLRRMSPRIYTSVIDQLVKDKKLTPEWRLALNANSFTLTTDIVKTIKNGAVIRSNAEKLLSASSRTIEDVRTSVYQKAMPYLRGLAEKGGESAIAEKHADLMAEVLVTRAAEIYSRQAGISPEEAAKLATDDFINSQYAVIPTKRTGLGSDLGVGNTRSYLMVPKKDRYDMTSEQQSIARFNERTIITPDELKKLGAVVPSDLPPEINKDRFYDFVSYNGPGGGRLVPTENGQGYYVRYFDRDGRQQFLMTAKRGANGKYAPLVISLERLKTPPKGPTSETGKMIEGAKGVGKSVKEAAKPYVKKTLDMILNNPVGAPNASGLD